MGQLLLCMGIVIGLLLILAGLSIRWKRRTSCSQSVLVKGILKHLDRGMAATKVLPGNADLTGAQKGEMDRPQWHYCHFKKPLPFEPLSKQVFYVESYYDAEINTCIREHYEEINRISVERGFDFVYLPETARAFLSDEAVRKFYYPMMEDFMLSEAGLRWRESEGVFPEVDYKAVFGGEVLPEGVFLFCFAPWAEIGNMEEGETCFAYCRIRPLEEAGLLEQFPGMLRQLQAEAEPEVLFRFSRVSKPESEPDFGADSRDVEALLEDVKQKLQYLRQAGVKETVIRSLFTQERKLSRVQVTADFRILLPDYAKEIVLNPLEKAVYFLFLRHPEGLLFKELVDCREELLRLYMWVGGRSRQAMEKSVDDLLDPTKNSLNEKCARIKAAFLREFDADLACRYYIDGYRGEPKKIDLPPELVEWERTI